MLVKMLPDSPHRKPSQVPLGKTFLMRTMEKRNQILLAKPPFDALLLQSSSNSTPTIASKIVNIVIICNKKLYLTGL